VYYKTIARKTAGGEQKEWREIPDYYIVCSALAANGRAILKILRLWCPWWNNIEKISIAK
jgi:hypothetical protein